ncbi:MAG: YitT family protein [Bacillota bacterium]|nr:YitT family protein [Bacillota bacterium]
MRKIINEICFLLVGSILSSIATAAILIPNNIGSGGITGIALSLNHLFGYKVGLLTILFNIPLFIFGFRLLGKKFAIKSGCIVFISSIMIDFLNTSFKFPPINDMLLSSIFCGALFGVSMSMIFMYGGSTGGTDILAKIINNKFKSIHLSTWLLICDILVYFLVALVLGPRSVMYALIMSFIRSKTMDAMQEGLSSSRQCIIICNKASEINHAISTKLYRGTTMIDAVGGYSNTQKKIIYVVIQKTQLNKLKSVVREIEPNAFVAISHVNDIHGNYRYSTPGF